MALKKRIEFSQGTQESSMVDQTKAGGVASEMCCSMEKAAMSSLVGGL